MLFGFSSEEKATVVAEEGAEMLGEHV